MSHRRPELETAPQLHYVGDAVKSYERSTRLQYIQRSMTLRALELMRLPPGRRCLLLDIGCGTGLSGEMLAFKGHDWIGADISREMLEAAKQRELSRFDDDDDEEGDEEDDDDDVNEDDAAGLGGEGDGEDKPKIELDKYGAPIDASAFKCDVCENDMGTGLPFRPGVFDGAVSISAVQWLLVASSRDQVPEKRIKRFFDSLQSCLAPGARAVLQFYPQNSDQINKLTMGATKCGFSGGVVVDYPHSTKARKYYLVIYSGNPGATYQPPRPLGVEDDDEEYDNGEAYEQQADGTEGDADGERSKVRVFPRGKNNRTLQQRRSMKKRRLDNSARPAAGTRDWVVMKKEERRRRGDKATEDSKYTMRPRKPRF